MTPEKQVKAKKCKTFLNVWGWETALYGNLGRLVQADQADGRQTWIELKRRKMKVKRKNERRVEFSMVENLVTVSVMTFPCLECWSVTMCPKLEMVR